jgi:hypothetical protein
VLVSLEQGPNPFIRLIGLCMTYNGK